MAGYGHEDDDYDIASDGEEFNEDTLDDAEYDQLYAQLPILKKELANYNEDILEIDMKEALYYNYYKIEDSVNELKDKYPRKKKGMYKETKNFKEAELPWHLLQLNSHSLLSSDFENQKVLTKSSSILNNVSNHSSFSCTGQQLACS